METKHTLKACIYGAAVGDAMGVPYEMAKRGTFTCDGTMVGGLAHNKPAGTWSDDTAMLLATCDSIRELGFISIVDMRKKFLSWMNEGKYACGGEFFGSGHTTRTALKTGSGQDSEKSNGNGSLMRIAPLAFCNVNQFSGWTYEEVIEDVSAITHAHKISTDICKEFVFLLNDIIHKHLDGHHTDYILNILPELDVLESEVSSGVFVKDTFFAALWCFTFTDNFKDCIIKAVNLGGDSDTTASVAGALAGTYYGYDDIPQEWINTLRDKDLIDSCLF